MDLALYHGYQMDALFFWNVFKSILTVKVSFAACRAISLELMAGLDSRCVPVKCPSSLYNRPSQLAEQTSSATAHSEIDDVTCVRQIFCNQLKTSSVVYTRRVLFCFCLRVLFYFAPTSRSHKTSVVAFLYSEPEDAGGDRKLQNVEVICNTTNKRTE